MKRITVLLVDDHEIVREGIRKLLELEDDLEVIGEAKNGRQAVVMVEKLRPAVVVMDIGMSLLNGLEAVRQILKIVPGTKIIILSAHTDSAYVKNSTDSGAVGFVLKQASILDLCAGIQEVNKGNTFFCPFFAKLHLECERKSFDQAGRPKLRHACLNSREMEVLQLIAEGKATKQIAAELGISMKTVERHREHLMKKLNIHTIAGLTRYAIGAGIIESSVQLTIV